MTSRVLWTRGCVAQTLRCFVTQLKLRPVARRAASILLPMLVLSIAAPSVHAQPETPGPLSTTDIRAATHRVWLPVAWREPNAAAPSPGGARPRTTPPPPRAVLPKGLVVLGQLPFCDVRRVVQQSASVLRVNEPLTLTFSVDFQCPELRDRATVVVVGGFQSSAADDVRRALHVIADTVAAEPGSRLAILDVAAPAASTDWAIEEGDYRALEERIDGLRPRDAMPAAAWHNVLSNVEARIARDGPRRRPLVLILDGSGALTDQPDVFGHMVHLAGIARDAIGHAVLFDLTIGDRLLMSEAGLNATNDSLIILTTSNSAPDNAQTLVWMLLDSLMAPLDRVGVLVLSTGNPFDDPVVTIPPAVRMGSFAVQWEFVTRRDVHQAHLDLVMTIRSTEAAQHTLTVMAQAVRERIVPDFAFRTNVTFCVAPPAPAPLECAAEPIATPAPIGMPTAHAPAQRPMPTAHAPAQRPIPTAPIAAPILGPVPICDAQTELRPAGPIAIVGQPITLTFQASITCPDMLNHRSVVLVVGGLPSGAGLDDARSGLAHIVDAFAAGSDNRLTVVDVAEPEGGSTWASTPDAYDAVRARIARLSERPAASIGTWQSTLDIAQQRLAEVDVRSRAFLIVVDGTGVTTDEQALQERIRTLGRKAKDGAGDVILVDLTRGASLFRPLAEDGRIDAPFVTVFPGIQGSATFRELIERVLGAYNGELKWLIAAVSFDVASVWSTCVPFDTFPSAAVNPTASPGHYSWTLSPSGHTARHVSQIVATFERPFAARFVTGFVQFGRSAGETLSFATTERLCAANASPARAVCPEFDPNAPPVPLQPMPCPRLNQILLPWMSASRP